MRDCGIFDIETDGLIETATKIHCMVVIDITNGVKTVIAMTNIEDMKAYVTRKKILVGHNIVRFDIPVLRKFFGEDISNRLVDTMGLSWYLYPKRNSHNLEDWGVDLGIPKPVIVDWNNLTPEEYIHRCTEDCRITLKLLMLELKYLKEIYETTEAMDRIINYITFKLDCAREQEEVKWRLDVVKCQEGLELLNNEFENKKNQLSEVMPKSYTYRVQSRPKVLYKKDGSLSVAGENWFNLLKEKGLPEYHIGAIKIPVKEDKGNPGSPVQIKDWLFDLGWEPDFYKYVKQKDGTVKSIPQVNNEDGVTDSVKALYDVEPNLQVLDNFYKLKHRIGLLKGFLENKDENDFLKAAVHGLANTMRFKHTIIVNLPKVDRLYGKLVRGCLIAPDDNHVLCGSDMSSLEDSTKQHYMYFFDPEYVKEMRVPGFDPHLDIGLLAEMTSEDEILFFKNFDKDTATAQEKELYAKIKVKRGEAKKVNFSGIYGAGAAKIALAAKIPFKKAKLLHKIYWIRNKAVKHVSNSCITKVVNNQMWLYNPVSRFWYSLRAEKDKFSTLNQGTGVYCFDTWTRYNRQAGIKMCGQFHDELAFPVLKGNEENVRNILSNSIRLTNEELRLNVELGISIDFGDNYAEIH